jgi:alkanesulfonate monooxygenase SsuD/methylene tetrahydromethanopterin reductase-like flavin-dependent oxidoreductase (luciferase family)
MDFGLAIQNNRAGASAEGMDASAEVATRLGWRSVWVADHLIVSRSGGPDADSWFAEYNWLEHEWILEAILSLTYVGARHGGLLLGLGVVVPPMRDAPQLAKELATLDTLTGGRLIVGVGVGDPEDELEYRNLGKGDRFRVRGAYLDETIELLRHLWSGQSDPFEGRFHQLRDFTFRPLPPQGRDLPIWTGGRSDRAFARIGVTTDGYFGSRWSPEQFAEVWPAVLERAERNGRRRPYLATRLRARIGEEPDELYSLSGTPDEIVGELLRFEAAGVDEVVAVLEAVDPEGIVREAVRFQREVVDAYRGASCGRAVVSA